MKIYLFVSREFTNVSDGQTDRQTPHDGIGRACIASRGQNEELLLNVHKPIHITVTHKIDSGGQHS